MVHEVGPCLVVVSHTMDGEEDRITIFTILKITINKDIHWSTVLQLHHVSAQVTHVELKLFDRNEILLSPRLDNMC